MACSVPTLFLSGANKNKCDCSQGVHSGGYPEYNLSDQVLLITHIILEGTRVNSKYLPVLEVVIATDDLTNNQWSNKSG